MSYFSSLCLYRGWWFSSLHVQKENRSVFCSIAIVSGISPSRGPFGLRPVLPGEFIFVEVCDVRSQFKDVKVCRVLTAGLISLMCVSCQLVCAYLCLSSMYDWYVVSSFPLSRYLSHNTHVLFRLTGLVLCSDWLLAEFLKSQRLQLCICNNNF